MAVAFTDIYSPFLCLAKPPLTGGFDHQVLSSMSLPGAFCGARHMKQPGGASMGFNDPPLVLGHARNQRRLSHTAHLQELAVDVGEQWTKNPPMTLL